LFVFVSWLVFVFAEGSEHSKRETYPAPSKINAASTML
jgi:hypothetical protein